MPKNKIIRKSINDKFYTKKEVSSKCIEFINSFVKCNIFIEPSAGDGSFSNSLPNCVAFDIDPENSSIIKKDFFDVNVDSYGDNICIVGNPPFGERNKLTKAFIEKCTSSNNVSWICFILPEVFKKFTNQKVFPKNWSLIFQNDLPKNSFILGGRTSYHVPCVFQIWEKDSIHVDLREQKFGKECKDFKILKPSEKSDADIFIFGSAPKNIINPCNVKQNNRGYFLKSFIDKDNLICKIKGTDWEEKGLSSVSGGVFWVSSNELIKIYTEKWEMKDDKE